MASNSIFNFLIRAKVANLGDLKKLGNSLQGVQGKVKNLARSLSGLKSPFKELLAIAGIAGGGAFIAAAFGSAAEVETLRTSIETLTGSAEKAKKVVQELQEFSQTTPFSQTELITVAERLKAFGVETGKVVVTTKRLADAAAANNVDLKRLGNTYGQVFAKGKFVQEENLQLLGQGINVTKELKDMYGLTGVELEEAMRKGRVPAEALEVALARMTAQSGEFYQGAQSQSQTLAGRLSQLQGAWGNLLQAIGETMEPLFKRLLVGATLILQAIGSWFTEERIRVFGTALAGMHKGFGDVLKVIKLILKAMAAWAAVTVGMSAMGVLGALIANMRTVLKVTKAILSVEKFLLGITKARAALQSAMSTAALSGKPLAGLLIGGGAGLAVFGALNTLIDKAVDSVQKYGEELGNAIDSETIVGQMRDIVQETANFKIPELLPGNPPKIGDRVGGKPKKRDPVGINESIANLIRMRNQAQREGNELLVVELQHQVDIGNLQDKYLQGLITERKYRSDLDSLETQFDGKREAALAKHRAEEQKLLNLRDEYLTLSENIAVKVGTITEKERDRRQLLRQHGDLQEKFGILVKEGIIDQEHLNKVIGHLPRLLDEATEKGFDFKEAIQEMYDAATNLGENLEQLAVQGIGQLADTFADFVATGKASFSDFAQSMLQDLARVFARMAFFKTLSVIPGFGFLTGSAYGNAFDRNGIVPFARGGVVNSPTISLMGEAGAEAILPLKRGADGRLGVAANGAMGGMTINIDVDATGSPKTSGNPGNAKALGDAIGAAVQQELIKQKRPGGLLAA